MAESWVSNYAARYVSMRVKQPSGRSSSWLTVQQLADALDVTPDYARRKIIPKARPEWVRREGRRIEAYGRGVIGDYLSPKPPGDDALEKPPIPGDDLLDLDLLDLRLDQPLDPLIDVELSLLYASLDMSD